MALGCGIAIYFALPREPSLPAIAIAAAVSAWLTFAARNHAARFRVLLVATAVLAGLTAITTRTALVQSPTITREVTTTVTGWVAWVEEGRRSGLRLWVRVVDIDDDRIVPQVIRVTVAADDFEARVGDHLRALVRLLPPSGPLFPGGFDFAQRAYFAGYDAVGFSLGRPELLEAGDPPLDLRLLKPLGDIRETIRQRVEAALPGDTGEIAAALITGDRGGISPATQEAMRASGLGHILAISGLHMALVAGSAFWIVRALLAAVPAIALRYPIKKWAAAVALGVAAAYLAISGGSIATQRAFLMLAIMLTAVLLDRRALTLRNVALAAILILLFAPEALLSASFQMSFAATAALVAAYEAVAARRRGESRRTIFRAILTGFLALVFTSLIAGLATAPFGLFHFQRVVPLTLLANVLAMPAVGLLVMPPALIGVAVLPLGLEGLPLFVMGLGIDWVRGVATWVTNLSGDAGLIPRIPLAPLLVFTGGFLWLVLWRNRWRWYGLGPILVALVLTFSPEQPDVMIHEGGEVVAVRGADGSLVMLRRRQQGFVVGGWLRADGDGRDIADESLARDVRCDPLGCTARIGADGPLVALSLDSHGLAEDCRLADVVVTRRTAPSTCAATLVIDRDTLDAGGAHALRWMPDAARFEVETAYPAARRPYMKPRRTSRVSSGG